MNSREYVSSHSAITMEEYERECCVRGYHAYQEIWEAAVGEVLECDREPRNCTDRHAVAVLKDSVIKNSRDKFSRLEAFARKYFNNENNPIYGIRLYNLLWS